MGTKGKKGLMSSTLLYWLIAVIVLVLVILFAVLLKDKLGVLLENIKNLFRR